MFSHRYSVWWKWTEKARNLKNTSSNYHSLIGVDHSLNLRHYAHIIFDCSVFVLPCNPFSNAQNKQINKRFLFRNTEWSKGNEGVGHCEKGLERPSKGFWEVRTWSFSLSRNEWTCEWVNELTNERMSEWTSEQLNERANELTDERIEQANERATKRMNERTNGQRGANERTNWTNERQPDELKRQQTSERTTLYMCVDVMKSCPIFFCSYVLSQILSSQARETIVENIHDYLISGIAADQETFSISSTH